MSSNFPYYHRNIIGLSKYTITYWDSAEKNKRQPSRFLNRYAIVLQPGPVPATKKDKRETNKAIARPAVAGQYREQHGHHHPEYLLYRSFAKILPANIPLYPEAGMNVVLDIRSNGGGRINLSTLLTKIRKP